MSLFICVRPGLKNLLDKEEFGTQLGSKVLYVARAQKKKSVHKSCAISLRKGVGNKFRNLRLPYVRYCKQQSVLDFNICKVDALRERNKQDISSYSSSTHGTKKEIGELLNDLEPWDLKSEN
ncbi:hypothetical protein FRX31_024769 [Thalictrum thalictroides]|uniref:Uncharacterized protein n=1 Tax=Thalictrum thalictroides TaxID=46969 RepID=A0A7J6VMS5_THATH|nr:hypothetical protein FRX31_024769 [Thalictrum thalictroides]